MTAFISYSGDRISRSELVYALREHGVTPWRDVESLDLADNTTDTIARELATCSGVVLWINEQMLSSPYVANVELPAIARAWRERRLRITPVFDGLSPSDAAERVSRLGIEIGESQGHVVDPNASEHVTAAGIASRYVRSEVKAACAEGRPPIVRLVSYDDTAVHRDDAILNFDWRDQFTGTAMDTSAELRLRAALEASTRVLKDAYGACEVTLAVKAHLPLALAVGHAFAEPTGCTVRMERDGVAWATTRTHSAGQLQEHSYPRGPIHARAAAIEVAVSRDIEAGVSAYVGMGHRYRERVELSPRAGRSRFALRAPADCNAWAHQVGDVLSRLSAQPEFDRIDLFLACPVELAVAIGWWANATGQVEILNWSGKTGPYAPMWHLP